MRLLCYFLLKDANVKLIRELREEIESLRTMLHTVTPVSSKYLINKRNITIPSTLT